MEYWTLLENPTGSTYRNLMQVLCEHSEVFYFITRKELTYDWNTMKQFTPYIMETYKTKKWANTITKGPAATVYVVEANVETCSLLQHVAHSLYDWVAPNLPEDLTFMKNKFEWFSCTTHEEFGGFTIRSDYYRNILGQINGLKVIKEDY
ncbi:hypothetical protein [Ornithinibacillus xuwenensis]|uniref:Uncharacterized protein n=1 Tax=Ornithinibacillus xuwenensis TaxID=3144668 RepID=A0ABU9XK48_9BACI